MLDAVSQFKRLSEDFLKMMVHKAKQAEKNAYARREHELLEGFYAGVESILSGVEHQHNHLNARLGYWQTMSDLLKEELEVVTRETLQIAKRPNAKQLEGIKKRYQDGKVTISQICDHFYVTDDEIKEIINGQKKVVK